MRIKPISTKKAKTTISSVCRTMIIAGRSDGQIWAALRRTFQIDEGKRYYLGWYRAEVVRKGLIKERRKAKQPIDMNQRRSGFRYATVH